MGRFRRLEKAKHIGHLKKENLINYWPASIIFLPSPMILEQMNIMQTTHVFHLQKEEIKLNQSFMADLSLWSRIFTLFHLTV